MCVSYALAIIGKAGASASGDRTNICSCGKESPKIRDVSGQFVSELAWWGVAEQASDGICFMRRIQLTRHEIRSINSQPSLPSKPIGQKADIRENPPKNIRYYYYHSFHGVPRRDIGLKTVNNVFGAVWRFTVDRTCVGKKKKVR